MQCFSWKKSKKPRVCEYIISISELKDNDSKETPQAAQGTLIKAPFIADCYLKPELKSSHSFTPGVAIKPKDYKVAFRSNALDFKSKTMNELKELSEFHQKNFKDENFDEDLKSSACSVF
ncbi:hypothetical protein SteCoe_25386 [Stentor coeruleus]|uniref:Uncharacterized protein n=1 Tax=Stentor coeruleus TaxID=5963 RepID=A0A1R2BFG4_9CILI|nr:hypothetical protein SteCoe_25386 [Stentor coeruleus]